MPQNNAEFYKVIKKSFTTKGIYDRIAINTQRSFAVKDDRYYFIDAIKLEGSRIFRLFSNN